jgi:chromate reductase
MRTSLRTPEAAATMAAPRMIRVAALCGSLRGASLNRMLLRAVRARAPAGMVVLDDAPIGALPHFNPDLEHDMPAVVCALRDGVMTSDALVIASPEYAHGIPGTLKNALDWLVSDERFPGKPVLVLNASPRSVHADAALCEVLTTMSARLVGDRSHPVPLRARGLDDAALLADAALVAAIDAALACLCDVVLGTSQPDDPADQAAEPGVS